MRLRQVRLARWAAIFVITAPSIIAAAGGGLSSIRSQDLEPWLTHLASDELQGRALYSSGLGLAAAYIEEWQRPFSSRPPRTIVG